VFSRSLGKRDVNEGWPPRGRQPSWQEFPHLVRAGSPYYTNRCMPAVASNVRVEVGGDLVDIHRGGVLPHRNRGVKYRQKP
jgi:hypothetical protein